MQKSRHSKKAYLPMVAAVVFFVAFLAGGLIFVFSVQARNNEHILRYLEDAALQRRNAIRLRLDGDLQLMRGVAVGLGELELSDEARVRSVLSETNSGGAFTMLGLASLGGVVDMVGPNGRTYRNVDVSGHAVFAKALGGQAAMSATYYEARFREQVTFYAVPVWKNGYMAGVLCAANDASVLRAVIEVPVFQGEGYFIVVDSAGTIVSPVVDPNPAVTPGASVFDVLEGPLADVARLRDALAGGGGVGHYYFDSGGARHLCAAAPLGVNGWWLLGAVPQASVNTYYSDVSAGTAVIIAAACLVFLFLLFWQMRTMTKNQAALEKLAYTDALTGARNYVRFMMDAERLLAESAHRRFAVWSFDVKRFNYINDMFGSAVGNEVLRRIAGLLEERETRGSFGCRVAADQFSGIRAYQSEQEMRDWFRELYAALACLRLIPDNRLALDGSMGVYLVDGFDEVLPVGDMVNRATIAKKAGKQSAGSRISFFTQEMGRRLRWEAELEAAGAAALHAGEITFHLQPKVAVQGGFCVVGAEVLARWLHPLHGWISPGEFIPVFEQSGFVVELDRYLFEAACKWYAAGVKRGAPPVRLAVNVSRQGLLRDDFIRHYTAVRDKYGIPPGALELEFTESLFLADYTLFQSSVTGLQANGFTCSIDDFGSGYSSLNVLKNLPIDVLKLDAAFFGQSGDARRGQVLVENVISMARRLSITTVAEGVETAGQVDFLRLAGCDVIQGYVFSKPLPQADFEALMRRTGGVLPPPE